MDVENGVRIEVLEKAGFNYRVHASYEGPQVDFGLDTEPIVYGPRLSGLQASPDPFEVDGTSSGGTDLSYSLSGESYALVSITIYDSTGQRVRTLQEELSLSVEAHTVHWDGENDLGTLVGPGKYIFDIDAFSQYQGVSKTGTVTAQ